MTADKETHTVRLPDVGSHRRCRRCGRRLHVDIGGGEFGEVESVALCLVCEPRPSTFDTIGDL